MVEAIIAALAEIPEGWRVFWLSMIPITELRVSIPLGIAWGLDPFTCLLVALLGNFLPVLPILFFLPRVFRWLRRFGPFARLVERLERKGRHQSGQVQRYGLIGLLLFVAIPLPGTGVWSGSLVASLLRLPIGPAAAVIGLGMVLAGVAVSLLTQGAAVLLDFRYGLELLILLASLLLLLWLWRRRKKRF